MQLIIHDSSRIDELQKDFNKQFPYLKLEFFEQVPLREERFSKENMITQTDKTLGSIRHLHINGHISINANQQVKTLEKKFHEQFGLSVQVFRKSKSAWIVTTSTDHWKLSRQNSFGKESSEKIEENEKVPDYNLYG